ncbi:VanZ family protein [Ruminococcus sp. zg-921]|uniref:VanZ family protein n=1 Tax=Ruminococcus sp. zg-921 TaxID=2678506 RepID=UPI00210B0111|nr:VanZ family protein [Ruminococcus sp. zg-921]MCQ4115075.1 hypothetical protein [Ruminococcus sp. zg-921]
MLAVKLKKSSIVFIVLTVLSAVFFILNSLASSEASNAASGFFVSLFTDYLFPTSDTNTIHIITLIVRKLAHFTEFAVFFGFFNSFMISQNAYKNHMFYFLTLFLVLCVPLLDETTQYLSPGRTPMVYDVWIDAAGGVFGIIASGAIYKLVRKKMLKDKRI